MTARRERGRGSWLGALLMLAVLAAGSFLVGALAGFVWKEPGLLVAYLRGDTTEVAWGTEAGPAPEREVAAAPAPLDPEPKPAPKPVAAAPKPVAQPPPAAKRPAAATAPLPPVAAAPAAGIAVQVGAFGERGAAERLRRRLAASGFRAYLAARTAPDQPWRVRVGPYASRVEAERTAGRLERDEKLPTWVLDEGSQ